MTIPDDPDFLEAFLIDRHYRGHLPITQPLHIVWAGPPPEILKGFWSTVWNKNMVSLFHALYVSMFPMVFHPQSQIWASSTYLLCFLNIPMELPLCFLNNVLFFHVFSCCFRVQRPQFQSAALMLSTRQLWMLVPCQLRSQRCEPLQSSLSYGSMTDRDVDAMIRTCWMCKVDCCSCYRYSYSYSML